MSDAIGCKDLLKLLLSAKASGESRWYKDVILFGGEIRQGKNGFWQNVFLCNGGEKKRLKIRISEENIFGRISPNSQEEVDRINALSGGSNPITLRTMAISVKIAKTRQRVEVEKDGFTIKPDFTFNEADMSDYFRCMELLSEIFEAEIDHLMQTGIITDKRSAKKGVKISNGKICSLVNTNFSDGAISGESRPNPFCIVKIKMDLKDRDVIACQIRDYYTGRIDNGQKVFDPFTVDSEDVNADNIHKVFESGDQLIFGVISVDSIAYSNMGISLQQVLERCILKKKPKNSKIDKDQEFYGDIPLPEVSNLSLEEPAAVDSADVEDSLNEFA